MTIQFTCHGCGRSLEVPDEKAGKVGRCRECGELVRVPIEDSGYELNSCDCINEMPEDAPRATPKAADLAARQAIDRLQMPLGARLAKRYRRRSQIIASVGWCVGLAGIFLTVVWPGIYRYERVSYAQVQFIYRINRITGSQLLVVDPVADRARVEAELEREAARQRAKDEELILRRQDGQSYSFPKGTPWEEIRDTISRYEKEEAEKQR